MVNIAADNGAEAKRHAASSTNHSNQQCCQRHSRQGCGQELQNKAGEGLRRRHIREIRPHIHTHQQTEKSHRRRQRRSQQTAAFGRLVAFADHHGLNICLGGDDTQRHIQPQPQISTHPAREDIEIFLTRKHRRKSTESPLHHIGEHAADNRGQIEQRQFNQPQKPRAFNAAKHTIAGHDNHA